MSPGDIVVGDGEGVAVIPIADAEAIATAAEAAYADEAQRRDAIPAPHCHSTQDQP